MKQWFKKNLWVLLTGGGIGGIALVLVAAGNPANMGFCIACFLRDIAGACRLHSAEAVQYVRPEILGIVLGACAVSLIRREFKPRGGSAPVTRFMLGFLVMIGALIFLGCPLRMILRLGGGDLNALVGLAGFVAGVGAGALALAKGFSLRRAYPQGALEGAAAPIGALALTLLSLAAGSLFASSQSGPGASRAPWLLSLAGGLIVGGFAQRSRFCMAGGVRDGLLFRDFHLLWGSLALLITVLAGNLMMGKFSLGFENQPVAHTDGMWNFMGMLAVGWGSALLGGCPLRQLVLAGEGNADSAVAVVGMVAGAAFSHNFGLASSGAGTTPHGRVAACAAIATLLVISVCNLPRKEKKQ